MNENLKSFLRYVSENPEVQEKLKTAEEGDINVVVRIASEHGYALSAEDFKPNEELTSEELEQVAGGGICVCPAVGGGSGMRIKYKYGCGCVGSGAGEGIDGSRCICVAFGWGDIP